MQKFSKYNYSVLSFILLILLWQLLSILKVTPNLILPSPSDILFSLFNDFSLLMYHLSMTLLVAILGLIIGIILSFIVSIVLDYSKVMHKIIYPYLLISQTIPTIAIAPMLVLWFGYGILPKLILVVITTIFPITISLLNGFSQCDREILLNLELLGASKKDVLFNYKIPYAISYLMAGVKISVTYSIVSAVVSEWLGGFVGLGVYMIRVKKAFAYDKMFGAIIIIIIVSLLLILVVDKINSYLKRRRLI